MVSSQPELRLWSRLHHLRLLLRCGLHKVGHVACLFVQQVREVRGKGVLGKAQACTAANRVSLFNHLVGTQQQPTCQTPLYIGVP